MPEIAPLRTDQIAEARQVIYTTAYHLFHDRESLEEAVAYYRENWPLLDIDAFQQRYMENGGVFLVLRMDGHIAGTGALRRLEPQVGEIKRLWLLPQYQGQGLGYLLMVHLLAAARERGYHTVRLETNPRYQARAVAFYRQLGFYPIPRYGDDPDDMGMELIL